MSSATPSWSSTPAWNSLARTSSKFSGVLAAAACWMSARLVSLSTIGVVEDPVLGGEVGAEALVEPLDDQRERLGLGLVELAGRRRSW